ncbi:hypothetical protein MLD38_029181 [Melastoma candidum]|uniref:Uncharacterized protein n=1 Tax=Melastoma candidum TaxID=119954 RepID=A0ACB9N437_9MYRT|nr:hypothetical protein MLD38_029181 [Melastoma candidum]
MDYYTFITAAVQNRWNLWNVRGFMILSLCMQLILFILSIAAPLRQKTSNRFVIFLVWSSYLGGLVRVVRIQADLELW